MFIISISIKKDAWKVKDSEGNYRDSAIFSTTLPEEANQVVQDARASVAEIKADISSSISEFDAQKQSIANTIAGLEQYGTDPELSTVGMPADAAACGAVKSAVDNALTLLYLNATTISASAESPKDLDNYTTPGNYRVLNVSNATYIAHIPITIAGRLIVMSIAASSGIMQVYLAYTSTRIHVYIRSRYSNVWSDWLRIAAISDVESAVNTAITTEATARETADSAIQDAVNSALTLTYLNATAISASEQNPVDMNDLVTPGNYRFNSVSIMDYVANKPTTSSGRLIVYNVNSAATKCQLYIACISAKYRYYIRSKNGSDAWAAWETIAFRNDFLVEEGSSWT